MTKGATADDNRALLRGGQEEAVSRAPRRSDNTQVEAEDANCSDLPSPRLPREARRHERAARRTAFVPAEHLAVGGNDPRT